MGGVGFSPSHAMVVGLVGFLGWVVLQLLLGWGDRLLVLKVCWDGWDGMGVYVAELLISTYCFFSNLVGFLANTRVKKLWKERGEVEG
jgi:hypothetical protein